MKSRKLIYGVLVFFAFLTLFAFTFNAVISISSGIVMPKKGGVFKNVTVINPGMNRYYNQTISIKENSIYSIGKSKKGLKSKKMISGGYALPGLIDMHVHMPPQLPGNQVELFSFLFIAHGVTTVRDMGSFDGSIFKQRKMVKEGKYIGPRIFTPGYFIDGKNPMWPKSRVAITEEDGRQAVREMAKLGVNFIKVYNNLTPAALRGIKKEAKAKGLLVAGHVPIAISYKDASLDDVQHLFGIAPKIKAKKGKVITVLERFSSWDRLTDQRVNNVINFSVKNNIANTPTLVVLKKLGLMSNYELLRKDPAGQLVPRYYRDIIWHPQKGVPTMRVFKTKVCAAINRSFNKRKKVVKAFYEAKAKLHVGTDMQTPYVVPGASLHEEMKFFLEAGIPLEKIWEMSTRKAGEYLKVPLLGQLVKGAPADILIFEKDPTKDVENLKTLKAVVSDGRIYTGEMIDRGLLNYQKQFKGFWYDKFSMFMATIAMKLMF